MKLAFALITGLALHFAPHHKYTFYLKQDDQILDATLGEDTFNYNGMLLPDYPVTGTGRKMLHTYQPGLTIYQGAPACAVEIPHSEEQTIHETFKNLDLWLDNNSILSQGQLQTYFSLKVEINGRQFMVPLMSPTIKVSWEGQGLFRISLDGLVHLLY